MKKSAKKSGGKRKNVDILLVEAVVSLVNSDNTDPSAEEIAQKYYGRKTLGDGALDDVRKKLPKIRKSLERDYGLQATLVNGRYYERYRNESCVTIHEGRRCLPVGRGLRTAGIKIAGRGDFIFAAAIQRGIDSGAGKVVTCQRRLIKAVGSGAVANEQAVLIAKSGKKHLGEEARQIAEILALAS